MTSNLWAVLATAVLVALAGCAAPQDAPTDDSDDAPPTGGTGDGGDETPTYALTVEGVPATVAAGGTFNFTLHADGPAGSSDHVGAHFGAEASDAPSTTTYPQACIHQAGELPGTFEVSCTIAEAGTWHLRGHVRTGVEGAYVHHWSDDVAVEVTAAEGDEPAGYTLTVEGMPTTVAAGENFTYNLTVEGPAGVSDHIGGHYGMNSTEEPSTTVYDRACFHQGGDLPGTFVVTCSIPEAGTWYLRGHTRTGTEGSYAHFWADEVTITVTA